MRANAAPVLRVRDARVAIAWWAHTPDASAITTAPATNQRRGGHASTRAGD